MTFPLVIETKYTEVFGVHPLMQQDCAKLCDFFKDEKGFVLGIFGSSVTWNCRSHSDLDIVIRLFGDESIDRFYKYSRMISRAKLAVETDVIFYNELSDTDMLKSEIRKNAYPLIYSDDIVWVDGKWQVQ